MGEIWGRNGRETAVAEWRWGQVLRNAAGKYCYREGISKEDHSAWHLRDNPHASNPRHLAAIASAKGPL